jgi:spore maturation protein CgeB
MAARIFIAGETGNNCLEMSYYKAFMDAGNEVRLYDTAKAIKRYARFGRFGYRLHQFFPVEAWLKKANKDFTEEVKSFCPDIIIAFSGAEILPGSFAYIKSILPAKIIWYWADPLPNLSRYLYLSLSLTDLLVSYSNSSLKAFAQMGARQTYWLPFAADADAHFIEAVPRLHYSYDISFIGSWRPEREEALRIIFENFPGLRFKISGPYWNRCSFAPIRKLATTQPVYGKLFSEIVQDSFLNLNVIDKSNFPAVNMRFFEIMAAGGLELCSRGPEMNDTFTDKQHLLYFDGPEKLVEAVRYAFANKEKIEAIKIAGQQLLRQEHLYIHRARSLQSFIASTAD